jgi:HAD superfamily hydrolase (TIGR01458 family)
MTPTLGSSLHLLRLRGNGWLETIALPRFSFIQIWPRNSKSDRVHRAVVVGDAGEAFHYASLNRAFRELIDGAVLIALAKNRSFKDDDSSLSLDAGAFVAALEFATQRTALVLGKPAPGFFEAALASMDCPPKRAVMVGDDAEADVAGALRAGLGGAVLVRTGKYCHGDEERFDPPPTVTVESLSAAADWIVAHRPLPPSCRR